MVSGPACKRSRHQALAARQDETVHAHANAGLGLMLGQPCTRAYAIGLPSHMLLLSGGAHSA